MVGRTDEAVFPVRPRAAGRGRAAARAHTLRLRLVFVLALLLFGAVSVSTSIGLLARVTPALFPGQSLPGIAILDPLPQIVNAPSREEGEGFYARRINLLVIGVDKRPQYQDLDGYLTDMIMVATIDPQSKQISLLSFPRDMWIDIHTEAGEYQSRINESYGIGFREQGRTYDAGAAQLSRDLHENFGIEIDHWVIVDWTGVYDLIDALGGVDPDIPDELAVFDWWYSDEDRDAAVISFPPGVNHLDGYHAVAFGRYREDTDLKRVKRQQLVMTAALAKVFEGGLLSDPAGLWDAYHDTVKTDLNALEAAGFAPLLKQTNGRVSTFSVGDPVNGVPTLWGFQTEGGGAVLGWDPQNVQYWLSQAFSKAAYVGSDVEVVNGNGDGIGNGAKALGNYLQWVKGLPLVYFGQDVPVTGTTTIILHDEEKRVMAEDIARWLGVPPEAIQFDISEDQNLADVVVVVGTDFSIPGG